MKTSKEATEFVQEFFQPQKQIAQWRLLLTAITFELDYEVRHILSEKLNQ